MTPHSRTALAKTPDDRIPFVLEMLFTPAYLKEKYPGDSTGRTYAEWQSDVRFHSQDGRYFGG